MGITKCGAQCSNDLGNKTLFLGYGQESRVGLGEHIKPTTHISGQLSWAGNESNVLYLEGTGFKKPSIFLDTREEPRTGDCNPREESADSIALTIVATLP